MTNLIANPNSIKYFQSQLLKTQKSSYLLSLIVNYNNVDIHFEFKIIASKNNKQNLNCLMFFVTEIQIFKQMFIKTTL